MKKTLLFICLPALASVTVPGSVTHIGKDAFGVLRAGGGALTDQSRGSPSPFGRVPTRNGTAGRTG